MLKKLENIRIALEYYTANNEYFMHEFKELERYLRSVCIENKKENIKIARSIKKRLSLDKK